MHSRDDRALCPAIDKRLDLVPVYFDIDICRSGHLKSASTVQLHMGLALLTEHVHIAETLWLHDKEGSIVGSFRIVANRKRKRTEYSIACSMFSNTASCRIISSIFFWASTL